MRAALQTTFGGPEAIVVTEVPDPHPEHHDVIIAVGASALNRLDVLQREGPAYVPGFSLPHIAGMDIAGTVLEVGPSVRDFVVGDRVVVNPSIECGVCDICRAGVDEFCANKRVLGANAPGGFAEQVLVPDTHVHKIPDSMSFAEAATIPTVHSTAWGALVETGELRVGEWLLVHAAGSGVSTAAIQLARRMGARVIATAGSEPKLDHARSLGVEVALNNREDGWVEAVRAATGGEGVDMVFDHVGAALFNDSIKCLRNRGRMVFCGTTTGPNATFALPFAYHIGARLLGSDTYSRAEFARMLKSYFVSGFEPVIDSEVSLDEVGKAQQRLVGNDVIGKVVVIP